MDLDELKAKLENNSEEVYPTGDYDKRERMAEPTDESIGLNIPVVSNCASSCSYKEVKDIWNAAEKHLLHEMGEICKGDANYEEDTPDLNTYYERHYY